MLISKHRKSSQSMRCLLAAQSVSWISDSHTSGLQLTPAFHACLPHSGSASRVCCSFRSRTADSRLAAGLRAISVCWRYTYKVMAIIMCGIRLEYQHYEVTMVGRATSFIAFTLFNFLLHRMLYLQCTTRSCWCLLGPTLLVASHVLQSILR